MQGFMTPLGPCISLFSRLYFMSYPLKTWALHDPIVKTTGTTSTSYSGIWLLQIMDCFLYILSYSFFSKHIFFLFSQSPISFQGVIDYIFYSKTHMNVLGVLGPLDPQWLVENNITGCPHPHIPSDHFSLLTQLELHPPLLPLVNGVHLPTRR